MKRMINYYVVNNLEVIRSIQTKSSERYNSGVYADILRKKRRLSKLSNDGSTIPNHDTVDSLVNYYLASSFTPIDVN